MLKILGILSFSFLLASCAAADAYHRDYPNGEVSPLKYLFYSNPNETPSTPANVNPNTNEPPAIEAAHRL